jgi:hypothetical protein
MKIEYVTGNLLIGSERIMLQGCNAQGRMASVLKIHIIILHPCCINTL